MLLTISLSFKLKYPDTDASRRGENKSIPAVIEASRESKSVLVAVEKKLCCTDLDFGCMKIAFFSSTSDELQRLIPW